MRKYYFILLMLFCTLSLLAACGGGEPEPARDLQVRALQPTFTPTPKQAAPDARAGVQATPVEQPAQPIQPDAQATQPPASASTPKNPQPGEQSISKLQAVINSPIVNLREGPTTNYRILQESRRGDQFEIVGKVADGSWWQVCCVADRPAWVKGEFVDTEGAVENAPVVVELPPTTIAPPTKAPVLPPPAPTTPPVAQPQPVQPAPTQPPLPPAPTTPPVPVAPPAPAFEFNLQATDRFPETNVMRVFMFVIDAGGTPMAGYSLRVKHNGVELPVNTPPTQTGFELTWPINDSRQRFQNFKVEFPGESRAGTWEAQLVRDGQPVGPPATFTIAANDENGEMYVRYQKK